MLGRPVVGRDGIWGRHRVPAFQHSPTRSCFSETGERGNKPLGASETCWDWEQPGPKLHGQRKQHVHAGHKQEVLSSHKAEFFARLWSPSKTQNHLAKVGTNESPGTPSVTRGHSLYLWVCILQPLVAPGVGLIDMVCLSSGFPYADAYYVICLGYLHSLWGPFWSCAKLGTENRCIVI